MRYNQLGRTGLFVSEICLGTMTFGGAADAGIWRAIGSLEQGAVDEIVGHSLAAGVNFFDTADVYSFGESERLLGQAFRNLGVSAQRRGRRDQGVRRDGPRPERPAAPRAATSWTASGQPGAAADGPHRPLPDPRQRQRHAGGRDPARARRPRRGRAWCATSAYPTGRPGRSRRRWGVSEAQGLARFETPAGLLFHRRPRPGARDRADADRGKRRPDGLVAAGRRPAVRQVRPREHRRPRARAASSFDFPPVDKDRAWACVAAMREIGDAHGVSVARVALAWLLAKPHVMSVIIGAKTLEQLDDNLAAVDLTPHAPKRWRSLDEVSALPSGISGLDVRPPGGKPDSRPVSQKTLNTRFTPRRRAPPRRRDPLRRRFPRHDGAASG